MQAKPPRANAAAASSESIAAWAPRFRRALMEPMMGPIGKRAVTVRASPLRSCDRGIGLRRRLQSCGFSPPVFQRQRQLFRCFNAVTAAAFGLVEGGVGRSEQHLEFGA